MNFKDLEGSGRDLIEVISWHLIGGTEEYQENPQSLRRPISRLIFEPSEYMSTALPPH
jgi:hypothetical protein